MSEIFLVQLTIRYEGWTMKQFHELLLKQAAKFSAPGDKIMEILGVWMVAGENTMYLFLEGCGDLLDKFLINMPIMTELGSQIESNVTPLYGYEAFANGINKIFEKDKSYEISPFAPCGNNVYYLLQVDIEQRGLTRKDFIEIWLQEIDAALGAKKANIVVDLWKVVAMRKVFVLLCVDSPSTMDMTSFSLPMMQKMGDNMFITTKRLRKFEALADDLK